jgi:hypothetical protein
MAVRAFLCSVIVTVSAVILAFQNITYDKYIIIPLSLLSLIICLYAAEKKGRSKLSISGIIISLISVQIGLFLIILRSELF